MKKLILILDNIRSTYNVGAIARTAECLGVEKIYATGYTPNTTGSIDTPPHVLQKMKNSINKTALGAETNLPIHYESDIFELIDKLVTEDYKIIALEQCSTSKKITEGSNFSAIALILGEETKGIPKEILNRCDEILEIPMLGDKESFNVSVAAGIALYELRRDLFIEQ
jgi:tRNA G18 (ribose-2'-O)-methylase SpoU